MRLVAMLMSVLALAALVGYSSLSEDDQYFVGLCLFLLVGGIGFLCLSYALFTGLWPWQDERLIGPREKEQEVTKIEPTQRVLDVAATIRALTMIERVALWKLLRDEEEMTGVRETLRPQPPEGEGSIALPLPERGESR